MVKHKILHNAEVSTFGPQDEWLSAQAQDAADRKAQYEEMYSDEEPDEFKEKEDTRNVKDYEDTGNDHNRRERRPSVPGPERPVRSSSRKGLGGNRLLSPIGLSLINRIYDEANLNVDFEEVQRWFRESYSSTLIAMAHYRSLQIEAGVSEFPATWSRSKRNTYLARRELMLSKNRNFYLDKLRDVPFISVREAKAALIATWREGKFEGSYYSARNDSMRVKAKKDSFKNNFVRRKAENGANGERTMKDGVSRNQNQLDTIIADYNRTVRKYRGEFFTRNTTATTLDRQIDIIDFDIIEIRVRTNFLHAIKSVRDFSCRVGGRVYKYRHDQIVIEEFDYCSQDLESLFWYDNDHVVHPEENGSHGEVSETGWVVPVCPRNLCGKHWHKVSKAPKSGAERRMAEKKKDEPGCKPCKIEDLVICVSPDTSSCSLPHYHITKNTLNAHKGILMGMQKGDNTELARIAQSVQDEVERTEANQDAELELQESLVATKEDAMSDYAYLTTLGYEGILHRRPIDRLVQREDITLSEFESALRTYDAITDGGRRTLYISDRWLDEYVTQLLLAAQNDEAEFNLTDQRYHKPSRNALMRNTHVLDFELYKEDMQLTETSSTSTSSEASEYDSSTSSATTDTTVTSNNTSTTSTTTNTNTTDCESTNLNSGASVAPLQEENQNQGMILDLTPKPKVEVKPIYTVDGWRQEGTPIVYTEGPGQPLSSYRDLRMETVNFVNRKYKWFAYLREMPRRINGWWTSADEEDPYYYGRTGRQRCAISLSLLESLRKTRTATKYSEASMRSIIYQANMSDYPFKITEATVLYFIEQWVRVSAQLGSLDRANTTYLSSKIPMLVPKALEPSDIVAMARRHPVPAGAYHCTTVNPIHVPHIESAYFGGPDDPQMVPNLRWKLVRTSGGASFVNGYVRFKTSWVKASYESLYSAFASMAGVVGPSTQETEKILLRLTMDKTGRDSFMIQQQYKAYNSSFARQWLATMGDTRVYAEETGFLEEFFSVYINVMRSPIYSDDDWAARIREYTIETGIKVLQRERAIEEMLASPHIVEKKYNEVTFKPDENQKVKIGKDGGHYLSYARAFIALPGVEWAQGNPHHISKFKSKFAHTFVWTSQGFISDDGYDPTPTPTRPWRHQTCLYPVYTTQTGDRRIDIDNNDLATSIAAGKLFCEQTGGIATYCHGDDVYVIDCEGYSDIGPIISYVEADVVSNDISHTQFAFAKTAEILQATGFYTEAPFRQMQRNIRMRNGPYRKEFVELAPILGMTLPTGSVLTTSHNSVGAMSICYAMVKFGPLAAADHIGYTLEIKKFARIEQATFLAHYFYESPDGVQVAGTGSSIACSTCPSVLIRGAFKTKGDFLGSKKLTVVQRGIDHMQSVVKGYLKEPPTPITNAFRELLPVEYRLTHPIPYRSPEAQAACMHALVNRANNGGTRFTEQDITDFASMISSISYGTVIVSPVADAFLLVRYGIPPTAV